jgi:hypothetical protein
MTLLPIGEATRTPSSLGLTSDRLTLVTAHLCHGPPPSASHQEGKIRLPILLVCRVKHWCRSNQFLQLIGESETLNLTPLLSLVDCVPPRIRMLCSQQHTWQIR